MHVSKVEHAILSTNFKQNINDHLLLKIYIERTFSSDIEL